MNLIEIWNYNETWLQARCPSQLADFEKLLLAGNDGDILIAELERLLQEAQDIRPTSAGLRLAFANIWLSLEVWANDLEQEAYAEMIDAPETYDELEEFLLQMIDNYQPTDLVGSRFYDEKGF